MKSLKELYKIGRGPSSSHTMGPSKAAKTYAQRHPEAKGFEVTLYGSLSATGKGHLTDVAIKDMLEPVAPVEIVWSKEFLPFHPNAMKFAARTEDGSLQDEWIVYSIGGGTLSEGEADVLTETPEVYPLNTMKGIQEWCEANGCSYWEYVEACEGPEIWDYLETIWKVMQNSVEDGLQNEGVLPGPIHLQRKATVYYVKANGYKPSLQSRGLVHAYALAVSEQNAAGGTIVTAPTCGSSGVMPAVMYHMKHGHNFSDKRILRALATGGLFGNVVKQNASGLSGIVGANYGFSHFANGNFAIVSNTPKASWRLNGNVKYEDDIIDGTLFRKFVSSGNSINQQFHSAKTTFNGNIGAGATFRPDKKNTVAVDLKLLLPRYNTKQDFRNTYSSGGSQNMENRYSDVTWNRENLDASASWRHLLQPDFSEFTLGGNVSKIWGHRPSFYYFEGKQVGKSDSGGSPFISSVQGDFKFKFAPGVLDFGAKMTFRMNDQYSEFFTRSGEQWVPSPEFSADLLHQEYVPALYAMFSSKDAGRFSYKAGLRVEYSIVKLYSDKESIDRTKGDFFFAPSLSGSFKISPVQSLSLAYGRRIGRPTYPQLNPYMSMIDAKTFEQGNLDLNPEQADNLDLSYTGKTGWFSAFADLYLSRTKGYITQVSNLTDGDILLMTYINCTSDLKTGLDLSLKISPVKWFDATLSANTFYTDTKGDFENIDINNSGWSNNSNLLLNFLPLKNTDIQMQYFLSSPQYYPQFTTAFNHYMNLGIKQTLCKGAITLSATATDVFGTDKWEIHSSNRIFTLDNTSLRKSRMIWLGISYNFNSFKQQKNQKKQEEDRSRLNLGL